MLKERKISSVVFAFLVLIVSLSTQFVNADSRNQKNKSKNVEITEIEATYQQLALQLTQQSKKRVKASFTSPKGKIVKVAFSPDSEQEIYSNRLRVTATAYTSHANQTDSSPFTAAWGDRLRPGMKAIAVSRDLLKVYGLKHKQKVRIKGLEGEYVVLDKMNKRWRKKIDIYMGLNKRKAFQWGRRKVDIHWN